jgi:type II secretory pathway component PulM
MKFWKKLSPNEKVMLLFTIALLLGILLSWQRIAEGLKKGFEPYLKEAPLQQP